MGIKGLLQLIKKYAPGSINTKIMSQYKGCYLINDAIQQIYKYCIAIRKKGSDMTSKNGKVISHLYAIKSIIQSSLKYNIIPIFIFDGKSPDIKYETIKMRKNKYKIAKLKLEEDIIGEEKIKYYKKTFRPTEEMITECKTFLTLSGIPWIQAPEEADSECASITKSDCHNVNRIISDDMDMLVFGSPYLLKNFNKNGEIMEISLQKILEELKVSHSDFVDICILIGCDYCPSIKGINAKKVYEIYKEILKTDDEQSNILMFLDKLEKENMEDIENNKKPRYIIPNNYLDSFMNAKTYYLEKAIVNDPNDFTLKQTKCNRNDIIKFMVKENGFYYSNIKSYINQLDNVYNRTNNKFLVNRIQC